MTTGNNHRYGVRVGDDGRWHLKTCSYSEAHAFAVKLSNGEGGRAQIVNFGPGGGRATYECGARIRDTIR